MTRYGEDEICPLLVTLFFFFFFGFIEWDLCETLKSVNILLFLLKTGGERWASKESGSVECRNEVGRIEVNIKELKLRLRHFLTCLRKLLH